MARETKMQKLEREHAELTEEVERLRRTVGDMCVERRQLEERCAFLYNAAIDMVAEQTRARLVPRPMSMRTVGRPGEISPMNLIGRDIGADVRAGELVR